ncbi:unnamed protein product [Adineta steineri]|uniref:Nuclear receptor domain-containing protein n=1 Tax=Adineta steineri TaxID=433720 RepID=A0A818TKQ7_9BILA|nr:unnamed protein product [Adineta steineri]CAF3685235.1 unnamed protein product [Adineta steineri]
MNFSYRSKPGRKKTRKDDDICLICGGRAIGVNFGVQSCSPCKAFFRRNAVKLGTIEFQCRGDGDCPVTGESRRQCNCCRLAKCIRLGMNIKSIRTDDQRLERLRLIESNRQKRATNNQIMIRPPNLLNYSSSSLSSYDQTLLSNIFGAYDRTCVMLRFNEELQKSQDYVISLEKVMNSFAHMYMALIEYYKFIPEFSDLSVNIKKTLVKNNLNQLFRINNAVVIKATGITDDVSATIFVHLFPPDLFSESCKCMIALFSFIYDPILLKLILIVLMFSTHLNIRYDAYQYEHNNENATERIFAIQNIYVELLWRYILYRCSNFQQAVKLFSTFITQLVYSQYVSTKLNEYVAKISPNQTDQLEPIMKAMWLDEKDK